MRLRATTKITAFIKKLGLQQIRGHESPMTPEIAKAMTRANSPVTDVAKAAFKGKASEYRMMAGFFGYATNTVHVNCKNAARLLSRFLSNPGEAHYKAAMYALGYLYQHRCAYIEYRRSDGFCGVFTIFTMVDADLGGDPTKGANGNSVMAAVMFLNGSHCYSYSKTIQAVCMSTHHTGYYAITEGSQMTIYVARLLRSLLFKVSFPAPVVGDNKGALATASVPSTKASRHINLREHWIREVLHLSDLVIGFIPGPLNAANNGTKILGVPQFKKESEWTLHGIHLLEPKITGTLQDLWMRMFVWDKDLKARHESGNCRSDVDANCADIAAPATQPEDTARHEGQGRATERGDGAGSA
jgi:hypothetical protein